MITLANLSCPRELILRLKAILYRAYFPLRLHNETEQTFHLGEIEVELDSGMVRNGNGQEQTLTAKEHALLEKLYEKQRKDRHQPITCAVLSGGRIYINMRTH